MKKLILLSVMTLLTITANADKSGKCGANVYYSYNSATHTLTISGVGDMWSNMIPDPWETPWSSLSYDDKKDIHSVIIESGVTSIGKMSFRSFIGLTSITIPNSVTTIGDEAFLECSNLVSITFPNSVFNVSIGSFDGTAWYDNQPDGLVYAGMVAFRYKGKMPSNTNISIKEGTLGIGDRAFSNCSGLTSITIPNSVTSIGKSIFSDCIGLASIKVEDGNMYYDSRNNCNAIIDSNNQLIVGCKNTIIPNSVTSIGNDAFYGCIGLAYIILPSNLTSIGINAFSNCNNLIDVYCKATNVPYAGYNSFSNAGAITLHVPSNSLDAYRTANDWSKFKAYEIYYDEDLQASEKCSKPTTSLVDGKLIFSCDTPDVKYRWSISSPDGINGTGYSYYNHITLPIVLTVFATKSGYQNSDVATYVFPNLAGDVNQDGVVNVADHVKLSEIIMGKE